MEGCMLRTFVPCRALAITLLVVGCATSANSPRLSPAADVTGAWTGGWTASFGGGEGWATFQQSESNISGILGLRGTPDLNPGGPVEGTIEGDVITLVWSNRNGRALAHFTVKGDEITGRTLGRATLVWRLTREK